MNRVYIYGFYFCEEVNLVSEAVGKQLLCSKQKEAE